MISRAASRTSSEAPAPFSVPSITAFSFSRVRSDAGILSIGVLLSQRPAQYRSSLIANQARVHPNPFPSKLRTSPTAIALINRCTPDGGDLVDSKFRSRGTYSLHNRGLSAEPFEKRGPDDPSDIGASLI